MRNEAFATLQTRLGPALAANSPGSTTDHALVVLPSYSVSESLLSHYGERIPSLEHRYLMSTLIPGRIPSCEILYISTRRPGPEVIDYYVDLLPADRREAVRARIHLLEVDDGTTRSVAAKLVDRADLLADIRARIGDRPSLIEPWNVTDHEVRLALALGVPINGTAPEVRPVGFKSAGRRLFREAGVPMPEGREDVRSVDDVVEAVVELRERRPAMQAVVIKHDDSGAGDGNVVVDLGPMADAADPIGWLRATIEALPDWYLVDLAAGGVVEERIDGVRFTSPSAQADVLPDGTVRVLATHEQVLGGPGGQVYLGCRFPADPAYAPELARQAELVGAQLARHGAMGRFAIDFVTASDGAGPPRVLAIEVNLRKGGTTHPYAVLRNVVPGRYDAAGGTWIADADGSPRAYSATDNLVDPAWQGLSPAAVIGAVADAGLQFDPTTGIGAALHMLSGLAIDGRFGVTAIARTPDEADELQAAVRAAVDGLVAG